MGDELYSRLEEGLDSQESPVSIRLNPFKAQSLDVTEGLYDCTVPWCSATGRYLRERPNFTFDPLLHAGLYYVQEAASMIVDHIVRTFINQPVRMLDLCAAPGGKSTALRAALPEGSMLFSNEPMRTRAQILSENLQKFGHEDVIVTNNYPRDYRKAGIMFDAILADVPCSGLGVIAKKPEIRGKTEAEISALPAIQRDILDNLSAYVKRDGVLLYSTCTVLRAENEDVVNAFLADDGEFAPEGFNVGGVSEPSGMHCFWPNVDGTDGFFAAKLRRIK